MAQMLAVLNTGTHIMQHPSYLYGLDVNTHIWATMPYKDVLELKYELAYQRMRALYLAHFYWRDTVNIQACSAAMSFNDKLLKELK